MLNLYDKFDNPKSLPGYNDHYPFFKAADDLVWELSEVTDEDKEVLARHTNIIQKSAKLAFYYAKNVMKARWEDAEPYIMQKPEYSSPYAGNVIKGTWASIGKPEAEEIIMKDPDRAVLYARHVMKHRWLEAEPVIKKSWFWDEYKSYFGLSD